jgi:hypothetical protein
MLSRIPEKTVEKNGEQNIKKLCPINSRLSNILQTLQSPNGLSISCRILRILHQSLLIINS